VSAAGQHWDGSFGSGKGKADKCVEKVGCPLCGSRAGELCNTQGEPTLGVHYYRKHALKPRRSCQCMGCKYGRALQA
jgi:hypothetical protein